MQGLPKFDDPNLLVGAEHFSDAGVYRLADGLAVVQSVDFFPPLVNDAFTFGQIAAANALSDLYACGARPVTALNIVGYPDHELPMEHLHEILRGGAERVKTAGAVVLGGHSVRDEEIKYGLAVTGVVDPDRMLTNAAAAPGDVLVLTKALGTGFVTTASRAERCPADVLDAACLSMTMLNAAASTAAVKAGAKAATDVTGFGLAGHAGEMACASGVTIALELDRLPLLPGAAELAEAGNRTRANEPNHDHVAPFTRFEAPTDTARAAFLFDPQTSGGLLVALRPDAVDPFIADCQRNGATAATIVGSVESASEGELIVR